MAGVELIGLLFGAIALVEPMSKVLKSTSGVLHSSKSFQQYIRTTTRQYCLHTQIFRNESKRVLAGILTKDQIDHLFDDGKIDHAAWEDGELGIMVKEYLGGNFYDGIYAAIEDISETLQTLNSDLRSFIFEDIPVGIELDGDNVTTEFEQTSTFKSKPISMKVKSRIERRKDNINSQLNKLRDYNLLYQTAVNQFLEDQAWRSKAATALLTRDHFSSRMSRLDGEIPWASISSMIDNLHEATQKLSAALQKMATCSCHSFHLQLEMLSSSDLSTISDRNIRHSMHNSFIFKVLSIACLPYKETVDDSIVVSESQSLLKHGLSLRIELKPYANPTKRRLQTSSNPNDIVQPPHTAIFETPHIKIKPPLASKFKKTVAFAQDGLSSIITKTEKKRKPTENLENSRLPSTTPPSTVLDSRIQSIDAPVVAEEIDDLCTWLQQLTFRSESSEKASTPGYVSVDQDLRYFIHEEKSDDTVSKVESGSYKYESLLECLSTGEIRLSISQRMELAHSLAISLLLRLHSSSWIERDWSSNDVMLFLPSEIASHQHQWSPYVAAAFNDMNKIQDIVRAENMEVPDYKISYVVSLGIILLEIGLLKPLVPAEHESNGRGNKHFDAWMRACGEVKQHSVNRSMGPDYDRIVEICIKWLDEDELDDKDVQRKFYQDVVLGLEDCIQVVNSSKERRQRKKKLVCWF